ncbi:NAD-dependent epimerase/dehydratase family protein [Oleiharenicola lentus]|uniref:NAD-dependent epimerase/dehydratase family protein n=1 Tax=Oleiharenicola lentus TaxID=2508720 RepID=UPI003F668C0E
MPVSPQRIFVTGGRGRLASLVADHFRAPAHAITLFSREASPGFHALDTLHDPAVLAGADTIFHLAWSSLPATSEQYPGIEQLHDIPFLDRLLTTLAQMPAKQRPRLVFFSSGGAVYGNAPARPNREDDPCDPVGLYGRAKLAAEQLIANRVAAHGLRCTVLRISNPYGYPVPSSRVQGLIPHALRCGVTGQTLSLWGDGSAQKDFLYYTDFLSGLECVVADELDGIYNLSAGESHCIRQVIGQVETELARPISLKYSEAPSWDVHDSRLNNAKLSAATGWRPQVALAEGIRRAAAGYTAH